MVRSMDCVPTQKRLPKNGKPARPRKPGTHFARHVVDPKGEMFLRALSSTTSFSRARRKSHPNSFAAAPRLVTYEQGLPEAAAPVTADLARDSAAL
jgi:hypothetical protein